MEEELDRNNPIPPYQFSQMIVDENFDYENLNHMMDM